MQLPAMADGRHAGEHPTLTSPDHYHPIPGEQHTLSHPTNFLPFSHMGLTSPPTKLIRPLACDRAH